jgi:antitoxin ParD1/3/4
MAGMATRTTLNVSLTPDLSRFVESRLRSGKYQSASELVREALRLLEGRDQALTASVEEMKQEIEVGLAQLRRGEGVDGEEFFRRLTARRRTRRARRA